MLLANETKSKRPGEGKSRTTGAEGTRLHKRDSSVEDREAAAEVARPDPRRTGGSPPTLRKTQRREASASDRGPQHRRAARSASPFFVRKPQRSGAWSHATERARVSMIHRYLRRQTCTQRNTTVPKYPATTCQTSKLDDRNCNPFL